ncbi:MAG: MFS transporter [Candidatus Rokubacteria bacterium]|nr:MFS transporter [Candidatus Rokubacteria bacterium]
MTTPRASLTLAPFRVRSFRFQWPADLFTSWASEMEALILGWYVLVHTGSVLLLTVFGSLHFLGTLGAPMFGVLGDRLGGRAMLCVMRAGYAALALILMLLALAGRLTPSQAFAVAAVAGLVRPNDPVMRNALIGDTVPPAHFSGALSLSRTTMDSARVTGALAGAGLFAALGIGPAYAVVVSFYLAGLALTFGVSRGLPVHAPGGPPEGAWGPGRGGGASRPSHWRELQDGLVHIWTTPRLLATMWLAFLVNLTAYPMSHGLLPYVAKHVYQTSEKGLGYLIASFSAGALLGSIAMVVSGGPRRPQRLMVVTILAWYALLLGFGHARTLTTGALLLGFGGFAQSIAVISMATTLLAAARERFRGRVMGVRMLAVYGLPLGLMASGLLIERMGYATTVTLYCAAGLGCTALIAVKWRASLWGA